ncbi:MAG: hypothetical protein GY774_07435 [Planctomycetes bacterium]|nr:hypothetical protein [Planctomycetota bacterium]
MKTITRRLVGCLIVASAISIAANASVETPKNQPEAQADTHSNIHEVSRYIHEQLKSRQERLEDLASEVESLNAQLSEYAKVDCKYLVMHDFNGVFTGCSTRESAGMVVSQSKIDFVNAKVSMLRSAYEVVCEGEYLADGKGLLVGCQDGRKFERGSMTPEIEHIISAAKTAMIGLAKYCRGQMWYNQDGYVTFCPV